MRKEYVGLNTWLYIFGSAKKARRGMERLQQFGNITEVFLNNAYGFELRLNRQIAFED